MEISHIVIFEVAIGCENLLSCFHQVFFIFFNFLNTLSGVGEGGECYEAVYLQ